jgi:hypothetical protein
MSEELRSLAFRRGWRLNWLSMIHNISSLELQTARWLDPRNTNPYWTYVEFVCSYFYNLALQDGYEGALQLGLVSRQECDIVKDLHAALGEHEAPNGDNYDHAAILSDPAWHRVVTLAEAARNSLLQTLEDPNERVALSGGEPVWETSH